MHCSILFKQLKLVEERCQHPLTYRTKCSPQSGAAGKGLHGALADSSIQWLTKTKVFNTQEPEVLIQVTPQAPCTAQLCILYVYKCQTAKFKPRLTKCARVCCCLGWP